MYPIRSYQENMDHVPSCANGHRCDDEGGQIMDSRILQWLFEDLSAYINQATSQGREVLLTGDMNIPVFSDEACNFLGSCGLVDLLE
jgi:hypothetical protein